MESGNNIGTVIFKNGSLLQAFSPYSRAIGDLLVEDGIITETELLETLHLQKKSGDSPIGALFLKTGKVTFEIIEMMVHEQIRQAVKEFTTWPNLSVSFIEKEIKPFDKIHLPVYEFIAPEILKSAARFFSTISKLHGNASSAATTSTAH